MIAVNVCDCVIQAAVIEQVCIGAIEVGNFNLGPIGPMVKEANLVSLPFIFKSVPHMFRVLEGEGGEIMAAAMGKAGLLPLAWVDAGARSFYAQKAINTPADVAGLKIRVMNNDLYTAMISAMGGNPSPIPRYNRRSRPALLMVRRTTFRRSRM